jgi:4-hydroxy-3-methylbut-2-enyl diphosphate reductase IspH
VYIVNVYCVGVMIAVDAVINHLKKMSKQVTTPEEIAQVN